MSSVISVLAKLKADTGSFVQGMNNAKKATENFQKTASDGMKNAEKSSNASMGSMGNAAIKLGSIVKTAVVGFLAIQGTQFLKGAIQAASSFEAEFEGVNQSFGAGAKVVQAYAKTAASTAGLTEISALKFAKTFGVMGKSAGLAGADLGKFATGMVQAAGDLGSFYDLPTEDALQAINAGLRGQFEPLQRFNILISANQVEQKALAMKLANTTKEITAQDKVLARQALILEGMGPAAGDFVKYADDYANATKTVGAMFEDMKARVGAALLPALSKIAVALMPLIDTLGTMLTPLIEALVPVVDAVGVALNGLQPIIAPIIGILTQFAGIFANLISTVLPPLMAILTPILNIFNAMMGPISTLLNALMGPLSTVLTAVANGFNSLLPIIESMMPTFNLLATTIGDAMTQLAPTITQIVDLFFLLMQNIYPLLQPIMDLAMTLIPMLVDIFNQLMPPIIELANQLIPMLSDMFLQIMPFISQLAQMVMYLVQALMPLIPPLLDLVMSILPPLMDLFMKLLPPIMMIAQVIFAILIPVINLLVAILTPVITVIGDVIKGVVDAISGFIDWLWGFIEPVFNAILDGVNAVLKFFGQEPIPPLNKSATKDAYAQGQEIGQAKVDGEKSVTEAAAAQGLPSYATTTAAPATPAAGDSTSGGSKKKNSVVEFYKKMNDEIKQQKAKTKLLAMGLNEELAQSIVGAGEGWEKIYAKIQKGGTKAIKNLESKWVQTAAGMAKVADQVKNTMEGIQSAIMDGFDISKMGTSTKQIMGNARKMVAKAKAFGAEIVSLSKKGLNPTLLNQVIAAGPEEGLALARSIGAADITELNSLYNQLGQTAMTTGKGVATNQVSYTIQVNGGIGDKNTIGKSIVEAIKAYERTSGVTWRTT